MRHLFRPVRDDHVDRRELNEARNHLASIDQRLASLGERTRCIFICPFAPIFAITAAVTKSLPKTMGGVLIQKRQ